VSGPLLVTGGTGYLGGELLRRAAGRPLAATHFTSAPARGDGVRWLRLDVRDAAAVRRELERLRPGAVIHTAYRQDDRATTLDGAAAVASAAAAVEAQLVHISTDVVFDGEKPGAYTEEDAPAPVTEYGRAKADAERAVAEEHPVALVVRTSLLYGAAEPGAQERAVLEAAAGRSETAFFTDELRCPVHVGDLAAALLELTELDVEGILHVAGADTLDRYEFARLVALARGADPSRLRSSTVAESGLTRPRNCALAIDRARGLLRTPLRGARTVLEQTDKPQAAG
jgi:dTDP-4-dehydrorhamnose reductase